MAALSRPQRDFLLLAVPKAAAASYVAGGGRLRETRRGEEEA
jgi:hypothetical protein